MKLKFCFEIISLIILILFSHTYAQTKTSDDSIKVYTLDETVVTGTRIEIEKSKIPASISILNRYKIEKNPDINILSQLSGQIPGLFLNERSIVGFGVGPNSSGTISIRGIGGNPNSQVLVLIDGQPQFMGLFGHPINDSYLASNIEKVEVIRGPGSILYGSNAAGGTINIITRKLRKEDLSLQTKLSYGSFNTTDVNGFVGYKKNALSIIASLNHTTTDGHRKDGDDSFRSLSGFSKVFFPVGENFNMSADANISDSKFYDPGPENAIRKNNYYKYLRGRTAVSVDNFFNNVEGAFKLYYSFGKHDFFDGWHSNDNVKGITFYQNIKFYDDNIFTAGLDYKNYGGKGINNNLPPPVAKGLNKNYSVDETDVYGILQYFLTEEFTLNAGLRLTKNSQFGLEKIPQFGLTYRFDGATIFKANAGKAFRNPTIADLFFFPVSNESLEPERFWNYEVSIEKTLFENLLTGALTLFYIEGDNLIQTIPFQQKINSGKFVHKGIETYFSFIPFSQLKINLNYTYLHTDKQMPYAPEHQFNFHSEYSLQYFTTAVDLKNIFGLYPLGGNKKQNYTVLSLLINAFVIEYLQVFIKGENLTDAKYYIDEGYPSPGISFMTGVKANF